MILFYYLFISVTVYIRYHFVLVSGVCIVVRQSYTLPSSSWYFQYPPDTTRSYYNITVYIPYAVL